jgi:Fe-S-cluster containining protein
VDDLLDRLAAQVLARAESDPKALAILDYLLLRDRPSAASPTAAELTALPRGTVSAESDGPALRAVEQRLQTRLGASQHWLRETHVALAALIDLLAERGVLDPDDLRSRREATLRELAADARAAGLGLVVRRGPPRTAGQAPDCAARRHICRGTCCGLRFALRPDEVRGGRVAYDEARPFMIRQGAHGLCVHLDTERGLCGIYEDRPLVCRTYTCRADRRIWRDYERAEPSPWLLRRLHRLEATGVLAPGSGSPGAA